MLATALSNAQINDFIPLLFVYVSLPLYVLGLSMASIARSLRGIRDDLNKNQAD